MIEASFFPAPSRTRRFIAVEQPAVMAPGVRGIAPFAILLVSSISAACWGSLAYATGLI